MRKNVNSQKLKNTKLVHITITYLITVISNYSVITKYSYVFCVGLGNPVFHKKFCIIMTQHFVIENWSYFFLEHDNFFIPEDN